MTALTALLEAVADEKNEEPVELELILEDHVSTEAIEHLKDHDSDSWTLQFELPDHTVRIAGDGAILIDGTQKRTFG